DEIKRWQKVSLTCDSWSGPNDNFFCLTVHGVNSKWISKSYVLAVTHFPGKHSSSAIAEMIEKILKEWKIESIKIHCVVTDGANNMKAEVSVRWNSCLNMLEKLFKQRGPVTQYAVENGEPRLILTPSQWTLIEQLIKILKPAEEMAQSRNMLLSNSHISIVIPLVRALSDTLQQMELSIF
uniref:Transposase n=1 Tax=Meloidogyne javanica TaxID=6303 RepID=A0A915M2J3_MELJA